MATDRKLTRAAAKIPREMRVLRGRIAAAVSAGRDEEAARLRRELDRINGQRMIEQGQALLDAADAHDAEDAS